jgi:hypothetical protein
MVQQRSHNPTIATKKFLPTTTTRTPTKPLLKIYSFNTFFYSLLSTRGHAGVRGWTAKANIDLFELDRVLVPVNMGNHHWTLAIVNTTEERIEYYDSTGREGESNENRPVLTNLRNFMVEEAKAQHRSPEEVAKWGFYVPVPILPPSLSYPLSSPSVVLIWRKRQNRRMDGIVAFLLVLLPRG